MSWIVVITLSFVAVPSVWMLKTQLPWTRTHASPTRLVNYCNCNNELKSWKTTYLFSLTSCSRLSLFFSSVLDLLLISFRKLSRITTALFRFNRAFCRSLQKEKEKKKKFAMKTNCTCFKNPKKLVWKKIQCFKNHQQINMSRFHFLLTTHYCNQKQRKIQTKT